MIKCQHGQLLSSFRIGQVLLGDLHRCQVDSSDSLGNDVQGRLFDPWMSHIVPALLRTLLAVGQAVWEVLESCDLVLEGLTRVREDSVLKHELLKSDEHPSLLQALRLFAACIDLVKTLTKGDIEDVSDVLVHAVVETSLI